MLFAQEIDIELFAGGFNAPVDIAHAGDDRLFVVELDGRIKILNADGTTEAQNFLNITSIVTSGGEQGLLGLAFHPDYEDNGYFYVNYINNSENTVIARYERSEEDPNIADPDSGTILLTINQPFGNHNGGCLRFGPDGYLWIGMGDGGSGGDPQDNGQDINTLLGKMLRIDVDGGAPYAIPADNPFVGIDGDDEIWATGLRNPWKFSFNRLTGDLWIADVGQGEIEEIDMANPATAGLNYGWRCYEGTAPYNTDGCEDAENYTPPVAEYEHNNGRCSLTGGYVYTGETYPALQGIYIFADYCSNEIGWLDDENTVSFTEPLGDHFWSTFGEDIEGELYIGGLDGNIYRVVDTALSINDFSKMPFALYPNPADNEVFIDLKGISGATVSIYDMGGKLLMSESVTHDAPRMDTSALQGGMYLLTVTAGDNSYNQKLAIQ